jgi:thymidylate synthase (FAD)
MPEQPESLMRVSVPEMDHILGQPFPVLDDGFVRVIDYLGSDESIVQAARVSYGKGTKKIRQDRELIRYLFRHRHTSPFEMCEIKLHVRVPMDCWRQWIRHRTANVNEYSTRYSVAIDSKQKTKADAWRLQALINRQGSLGTINSQQGQKLSRREIELHKLAEEVYQERVEQGIAREQARKDLPLSTYTEAYWKIDLHNLIHFLELRMDPTAQLEIRSYATIIGENIVSLWCPLTWEAFQDYRLHSLNLSRYDLQMLRLIIKDQMEDAIELAKEIGFISKKNQKFILSIEGLEFEKKLQAMNLPIPWLKLVDSK